IDNVAHWGGVVNIEKPFGGGAPRRRRPGTPTALVAQVLDAVSLKLLAQLQHPRRRLAAHAMYGRPDTVGDRRDESKDAAGPKLQVNSRQVGGEGPRAVVVVHFVSSVPRWVSR